MIALCLLNQTRMVSRSWILPMLDDLRAFLSSLSRRSQSNLKGNGMWKTDGDEKGEGEEVGTQFSQRAPMWRVVGSFAGIMEQNSSNTSFTTARRFVCSHAQLRFSSPSVPHRPSRVAPTQRPFLGLQLLCPIVSLLEPYKK
jgi:hypothetical protein